jgi:hypothetical protein
MLVTRRGETKIKGKGTMTTYWIHESKAHR